MLSNWVLDTIQTHVDGPAQICIEDYAYGAKGRVYDIGENAGVLKHKLHKANMPYVAVPPTVIKKFASGKGNADKRAMYEVFKRQTSINLAEVFQPNKSEITSPVSDIVDSYFICLYAYRMPVFRN